MKQIITAIGNPNLNEILKRENNLKIMSDDIQYKEGILEFLELNKNIDFIILSELIPGNLEIKELIQKIKLINNNIQIILFLENKNEELENYLYAKGINFIFYNNQIEINQIIEILKTDQKSSNNELKQEIDELKKLVLEKNKKNNLIFSKIKNNFLNKFIFKTKNLNIKNNSELICVSGTSGAGKSIFTVNLAKALENNKILIIDFDVLNNSLHTILGVKKYSSKIKNKIKKNNLLKEIQIEDLIIKINSKIDLIAGINLLFDSKYKISSVKIKNILAKLKEKYEVIIIDTSSECFFDYTREIMKLCNLNIFITEANLIEIKKAKSLLNIYVNEWEINQKNFNILFNKYNNNSINFSILKHIFSGFNILGKLSNDSKYDLIINKNLKNNLDKKMQKEYSQIYQNLYKKV